MPAIVPKLIDQTEAATMLGISLANFKKLEREDAFPFKRRMVGSAVRYRNTDVIAFIMANEEKTVSGIAITYNSRNGTQFLRSWFTQFPLLS